MSAPRARVSGRGAGDGSLAGGLVRVDEVFLAIGAQPDSPGSGLENAVFGPEFACAQERHDGLVDREWAELIHEVHRQAGPLIGGRVRDTEAWFEPGGVECADAFGQEDGVQDRAELDRSRGRRRLHPLKVTSAGTHAASASK